MVFALAASAGSGTACAASAGRSRISLAPSPSGFIKSCAGSGFLFFSSSFQAQLDRNGVLLRSPAGQIQFKYEQTRTSALQPEKPMAERVNLIRAGIPEGCRNPLVYSRMSYPNLYAGITVHFDVNEGQLKSEYLVAPKANPAHVRIRFGAYSSIGLNAEGDLEITTPEGLWREKRPEAWQMLDGKKQLVMVSWRLKVDGAVGFDVGAYDHRRPLVIDPVVSYNTYLANASASSFASATSTALDSFGNAYFAGWIEGSSLGIQAVGQTSNQGSVDAFLVKISPGGALIFATYFGGSGDDRALGLTVDASNQPWLTGSTSSADLPLMLPFQGALAGSRNAFIAQFSAAGNLLFSTYLGGSGPDAGNGIAADAGGNVYVVGDTQSANMPLFQTGQTRYKGGQDAFVAKVSPTGSLLYANYFGGSYSDHGAAIAVDANGNTYVTGGTYSPDLPVRSPYQSSLKGAGDAFVASFDASGALVFSTFLGGSSGSPFSPEQGNAIAIDSQKNTYVAGVTSSVDFPVSGGVAQSRLAGASDGFVVKINPAGSGLIYSTFLGGTGVDVPTSIAVDPFGAVAVAGYTSSLDFPLLSPLQSSQSGIFDAFVTILNPSGNNFYFSSVVGGSGIDSINGVAIDGYGNFYAAGQTGSLDYPFLNGLPRIHSAGLDAFAIKITTDDALNFVERLYFGVFGTAADAAGLASWSGVLNQGAQTRGQVALSFFQMQLPQASGFNVIAAYISVLGRDPDYSGYLYWTSLFRSGVLAPPSCVAGIAAYLTPCSQMAMLNSFMNSVEFQTRFSSTDNTSFVRVVYQNVLGRAPDPGGLAFWVQGLNAGLPRSHLMQDFINSPEFLASFGSRIQTGMAYCAILLRTATPAETQSWVNFLSGGGTVDSMISSLISSPEFRAGL